MHLLATEPGIIADGSAAIDLAQTPGDIIVLASADTEIALIAAAQARRRAADGATPSLRLAPVMRLGHNFSVDLYMELVARTRLVVARLLGGSAYWPYGVERLVETCREHGIPLALLSGDDKPDPELARASTVPQAACRRLWRYLAEGGPGNADNFLRYAASLIGEGTEWAEPAPLLRAGLYWPGPAQPRRHRRRMARHERRRRADRLLSGLGAIGQHGAGRCARPGAAVAPAAPPAGLCPQPQGRRSRGAADASVYRASAGCDPQRDRICGGGRGRARPATGRVSGA